MQERKNSFAIKQALSAQSRRAWIFCRRKFKVTFSMHIFFNHLYLNISNHFELYAQADLFIWCYWCGVCIIVNLVAVLIIGRHTLQKTIFHSVSLCSFCARVQLWRNTTGREERKEEWWYEPLRYQVRPARWVSGECFFIGQKLSFRVY